MSAQLIVVNQHNLSKVQSPPLGSNCIDYSVLKQIDRRIQPKGFAIKYVLEGTEYTTNQRLLPNKHTAKGHCTTSRAYA